MSVGGDNAGRRWPRRKPSRPEATHSTPLAGWSYRPPPAGSSVSTVTYSSRAAVVVEADLVEPDHAPRFPSGPVVGEHVLDIRRVPIRHLRQACQQPAVAYIALLHVQVGRAVGAEE